MLGYPPTPPPPRGARRLTTNIYPGSLISWAIFLGIFFTPVVYIQNDQRVMGIILRYVCWGTHRPPPPHPGSRAADHQYISWEPDFMGNFFGIFFTPVVYIQNDQRVMGIILRYVCWGTHRPPPPPGSPAADHQYISWEPDFMGNFFGIYFTPVVYIQNDHRVMGIILRYVCWGTHRPPPPPRGARRLTTNIYPGSLISWAIFLEFFLHQLCIFKMISVSWGSF